MGDGSRRAWTILVVDDEPDICVTLRDLFELYLGAKVLTASSAEEALPALQGDHLDLIISDYKMPGTDGLEFLKVASQAKPEVPRFLITAFPDLDIAVRAINEAHVHNFLIKPLTRTELLNLVEEVLSDRTPEEQRKAAAERIGLLSRERGAAASS